MRLTSKQLLHLPVYTQSNIFLGNIVGFELDPFQHMIQCYYVKKVNFIASFLQHQEKPDYIVHQRQVISLNTERMLVEDALIGEQAEIAKKIAPQKTESEFI